MKITPMKSIRLKCLDCSAGQAKEVKLCTAKKCPLWVYRMGHRPRMANDTATDDNVEKPQENRGMFRGEGDL